MEDLFHVNTPYTSTLGRKSNIFTYSQTNIHSLCTKLPSLCTYHSLIPQSHHAPLQSTYHYNYRILLKYIRYTEPQSTYIISIGNFYLTPIKHMCKLLLTISNMTVTLATLDHTLRILATTSPPHPSNQTY